MTARRTTIAFVGDLMLGRRVDEAAAQLSPECFWGDVLPLMRDADAVFGNLECPITTRASRWRRCWKAFRFHAHPRVVDLLLAGNIRFVSLANNHILDCESDGLVDTIRYLDAAGISHAGAGRDLAEASQARFVEVAGTRVGVMSITDTMPEFAAGQERAGTHYLPIRTDRETLEHIEQSVVDMRQAGAQIVALSVHWGPNLRPWPSERYRRFARAVIGLGVDVFHGHSAHLIHGIEMYQNGLILYDTGDFLDDYWVFPMVRIDRSCLFLVEFVDARVRRVRLVPVLLERARVRRAVGREAWAIASRMLRSSMPNSIADPAMAMELHFLNPAVGSARMSTCPVTYLGGTRAVEHSGQGNHS